MAKTPEDVIRDDIRSRKAYSVIDPVDMIKLDAMENPYALPPELRATIAARVANARFNRYPDPTARLLRAPLREAMQIPEGMDVTLGNGSDELIQMLAFAVAKPDAVMLGLEPSFVMFRIIADIAHLRYVGVPLNADFSLNIAETVAAVEQHQPALIFIAYPNNPSGNLFDTAAIERIIEAAPGLVVVDEAYHAFAQRTFMARLVDFRNLLVMRTVSKLGLAGLRLGLVAGPSEWLQHIDKIRLPYNVNVLTQLVAAEVLQHREVLESQAAAIRGERGRLLGNLRRVPGVEAYDSDANFILFKVAQPDSVFAGLKERGVLIKNLNGSHALLAGCLRVTVGTPAENDRFLGALAACLAG